MAEHLEIKSNWKRSFKLFPKKTPAFFLRKINVVENEGDYILDDIQIDFLLFLYSFR